MVKNLPATQKTQVQCLGEEDPLEKGMAPTTVFLPLQYNYRGEFCGQRSLVGYSPRGLRVNILYLFSVSTIAISDDANCLILLSISITTKVAHLPEHRS